jgi:hypothetical protein
MRRIVIGDSQNGQEIGTLALYCYEKLLQPAISIKFVREGCRRRQKGHAKTKSFPIQYKPENAIG